MGLEDIVNKGKELFEQNKEKIEGALKSDKVEEVSDNVLDGAVDAAKKVVPTEHHDKIEDVRGKIDGAVGNE